jgi:hypothetical protein
MKVSAVGEKSGFEVGEVAAEQVGHCSWWCCVGFKRLEFGIVEAVGGW